MLKRALLLSALGFSTYLAVAQPQQAATLARPERHTHVTENALQVFLLHKTAPQYPADAKAAHIWGNVVMSAVIDPEGKVKSVEVVSGPEPLRQAALDCAKQWTFRPYLQDGEAIYVDTTLTVSFVMLH